MYRILAFVCVFLACLGAERASAEPALWSMTDADSTIYLFGTIHIMRPETEWRSAKIDQAIEASDVVWLEAPGDGDVLQTRDLVLAHGIDPKTPLNRKLSILERRQLGAALSAIGMPSNAMQPMRPWLAAITLVYAPAIQAGYDINAGIDRQIGDFATATQKKRQYFETMEQQVQFLSTLPPEVELELLRQVLTDFARGPAYIDQMVDAWLAGNLDAMGQYFLDDMKQAAPEFYETLIVRRNRDWSDEIGRLMAGSGTHFIAVGAAHLVGDDGLPALLSARGFTVTPQ
jgi:uncharacterized protein YbaP (TraB family)